MWFWPVNEMIELVSGMPAPQFGDESSLSEGSELVQGSSGSVGCLRVPPGGCRPRFRRFPTLHIRTYVFQRNQRIVFVSLLSSLISTGHRRFDSRHYQIFWEAVSLERGPPSLVSTTEELLGRKKKTFPVWEAENTAVVDPSRWPRGTLYQPKFALTSPTSGGRSVGIVSFRIQATEYVACWGSLSARNLSKNWSHSGGKGLHCGLPDYDSAIYGRSLSWGRLEWSATWWKRTHLRVPAMTPFGACKTEHFLYILFPDNPFRGM
jgi:hypothetical protein